MISKLTSKLFLSIMFSIVGLVSVNAQNYDNAIAYAAPNHSNIETGLNNYTYNTEPKAKTKKSTPVNNVNVIELDYKMTLEVYPNPSVDVLNLSSENAKIGSLIVYNNSGNAVKEFLFDFAENKVQIDVKDLPRGLYMVLIKTDHNQTAVKGFVKS